MRIPALAFALGCALFASGCSDPKAPEGRWEGAYESADTMVAARLQIGAKGDIRVSAPHLLGIVAAGEEQRVGMRERLAGELAANWNGIAPRKMEFDGETFRKPGGVAPQMEWDDKHRKMKLVVYFGTRPGLRIPLRDVRGEFSDDPFNP